jgi:hypothetical protein
MANHERTADARCEPNPRLPAVVEPETILTYSNCITATPTSVNILIAYQQWWSQMPDASAGAISSEELNQINQK